MRIVYMYQTQILVLAFAFSNLRISVYMALLVYHSHTSFPFYLCLRHCIYPHTYLYLGSLPKHIEYPNAYVYCIS